MEHGAFEQMNNSKIEFFFPVRRQIRESINYLFEEPMLHYYTSTLLKSFWPGGVLASSYPARTEDMREMAANAARSLLINNIPEVMCNLVGAETAKHGATKVFETVQNATYNKQLFYVSAVFRRCSFLP